MLERLTAKPVSDEESLQVGASTAAHAKVAWKYDKRTTLHASTRVSVGGYQLGYQVEAGGRYRWSHNTSTGLGLAYGSQVRLILQTWYRRELVALQNTPGSWHVASDVRQSK